MTRILLIRKPTFLKCVPALWRSSLQGETLSPGEGDCCTPLRRCNGNPQWRDERLTCRLGCPRFLRGLVGALSSAHMAFRAPDKVFAMSPIPDRKVSSSIWFRCCPFVPTLVVCAQFYRVGRGRRGAVCTCTRRCALIVIDIWSVLIMYF